MATDTTAVGTMTYVGTVTLGDGVITDDMVSAGAEVARSKLASETKEYLVPWSTFRVHDAIETLLPQPSANDDLGWPATQTMGTVSPYLNTHDLKTLSTTLYARLQFQLPPEYADGQAITLRINGGANTTVSDGTLTVDAEVYKADGDGGCSADINATAAQSINNLTNADKDFTITPTGVVSGDWLDVRIALAVVDTATATAVIGEIFKVAFRLTVQG